ncbi:sulfotransferase [Sulfitobacter sp. AS59]|uniref:tetratricopeptide repeat-containing sulfotransferase family protein n=1 Tax=Sulfitobacter sp. AS59 TaxID=3135784 RepID=UPI00316F429D
MLSAVSNIVLAQQELAQRRFKNVLKYTRKAQKEAPGSPVPDNLAGIALSAMSRPGEAVNSFKRAILLDPSYAEARKNLAQTYLLMGQYENALLALHAVPETPDVLYLKAQGLAALNRKQEALAAAMRYIAGNQEDKTGYKLRAFIRLQFGLIADALEDYEKVISIDPQDAETLTRMSLPLARHLRFDDALNTALRAVEIDPGNISAQLRLAAQFSEMGKTEQSIARYRHVLSLEPSQASALKALSEMLKGEDLAELEPQVADVLSRVGKGSEDEAFLLFARFHILSGKGAREQADRDIIQANKFFANRSRYNAKAEREAAEGILKRFPNALPPKQETCTAPTPIFVFGLPRSGTTLVEAMLGRHEKVVPLGERGTIGFLLEETIHRGLPFTAQEIEELRAEDVRLLPELPIHAQAYVDKMPANFRIVGFLKSIYPESKIVNVRRDPRDIALSMFQAHFSSSALNYTYDRKAMSDYFNLYARMMQHWHRVFPGQIYDIRYEALVEGVEGEGRKLAEHCGIEWNSQMASPDQTTSQVLTMSANQLRTPIHKQSIGKWQDRRKLLAPFLQGLDHGLWPEVETD